MSFDGDKIITTKAELLEVVLKAGSAWQQQSSNMWGEMRATLQEHTKKIDNIETKVDSLKTISDQNEGGKKAGAYAVSIAIVFLIGLIGTVYALENGRLDKLESAVFPTTYAK